MSEPERNFHSVQHGDESPEIAVGQRVRCDDYGTGEIVADLGHGIQILWDQPKGTHGPQLMLHGRSYVEKLERI